MSREPLGLKESLHRLREDAPAPARRLTEQIMRRVALLGHPPQRNWLLRRWSYTISLRPVLLGGLAVAAAVALVANLRTHAGPTEVSAPVATVPMTPIAPTPVLVRFALPAPTAETVYLAGDFNGWATDRIPLRRGLDGVWTTTVPLPRGTFEYAYVVDGRFVTDPLAERSRPDGFGGMNAVLRVIDPGG